MKIHINPKDVGKNKISTLINKLNFVFGMERKLVSDVNIFLNLKDEIDPLSALIIYKILSYIIINKCMLNPGVDLDAIARLFSRYELHNLIKAYINKNQVDKVYAKIKPYQNSEFFIAPHPINRNEFNSKIDLEKKYTKSVNSYYKDKVPELTKYINQCISEIASNYLYHALEDDNSILMAIGDKNKVEIICVDTSNGIISSLKSTSSKTNDSEILAEAFERNVSSKKENGHCGTGLWFVNQIVNHSGGFLKVYSEDYYYTNKNGTVMVNEAPYWKGSIVHLKLNIAKEERLDAFFNKFINQDLGLQWN